MTCRHPCLEDDGPLCDVCAEIDALSDDAPLPEPTHDDGDGIRCPWCKRLHGDLWDYDWSGGREDVEVECDCGRSFALIRTVSVDYEARPVPRDDAPPSTLPGPTEKLARLPVEEGDHG